MKLVPSIVVVFTLSWTFLSTSLEALPQQETADPYYQPPRLSRQVSNAFPATADRIATPVNTTDFIPRSQKTGAGLPGDSASSPSTSGFVPNPPQQQQMVSGQSSASDVTQSARPDGSSFERSRVLARVGGHPVFSSDLSVEAMQIVDQFIQDAPQSVKTEEARKLMPRLLPKYIQSKLLFVDVIEGLPDEANVDDIIENAGQQFDEMMLPQLIENAGVDSAGQLDAYYRALGSSLRKVRHSWAESELVKYMMRQKININPDVSHREMHDYYVANKDQYSVPAKVRWEQLLIRFDRFPTRQQARTAISELGNEVVYGAPLDAVAKRSSQGFKASEGGQQGWTTSGSLVDKNLDEILFTIEPNSLSEIITTNRGFAIVRVLERQEEGFISFLEAQSGIREKILEEKQEVAFQTYVDNVRKRIPVEVFEAEFVAEKPQPRRR